MPIENVDEIKTYLEANKDKEEVKGFVTAFKAPTVDDFKTAAEKNEEVKKYLQSIADTRVTGAIKTYEEKTLPEKIKAAEEALRKTLTPEETPEQKKLRELEAKIAAAEAAANTSALKALTVTKLTSEGLSPELAEYVMGTDEAATTERIAKVKTLVSAQVEKLAAELLGGAPPPKKNPSGGEPDLNKMTMEQYAEWYNKRNK